MIHLRRLIFLRNSGLRFLCTSSTTSSSLNKEALKTLRKRTGYSYMNCRKALLEFGADRLDEAEKWLNKLAAEQNWSKATKLSGRKAKEGLVSIMTVENKAAIIEVNCETDFVAKSDEFKSLVKEIMLSALEVSKTINLKPDTNNFEQINLDLDSLKSSKGFPLREVLTSTIGKLGENIVVPKLSILVAKNDVELFCYTHPKDYTDSFKLGKFLSVVGLRKVTSKALQLDNLAQQLCQHIVGMRSETLGEVVKYDADLPTYGTNLDKGASIDADNSHKEKFGSTGDESEFADETTQIDELEGRLLHQSFMFCPSEKVHEFVRRNGVEIVDFLRYEVGMGIQME